MKQLLVGIQDTEVYVLKSHTKERGKYYAKT